LGNLLQGQGITEGLVAHYSFDDCMNLGKDDSGNNTDAVIQGNPQCVCGVSGNALLLDGANDYLLFLGTISNSFREINFSISLYIKPTNPVGVQSIISKRESCSDERAFDISYSSGSNFVNALLSQGEIAGEFRKTSLSAQVPFEPCWTHIVFVRRNNRSQLFIDGELVKEATASGRVNVDNNAELNIANGECVGITQNRFAGLIDELRVYDRALRVEEIQSLYLKPDRIENDDAIIFLGSSVDINIGQSCATSFSWTPTNGVSDPSSATPSIAPESAGEFTYQLSLADPLCIATDTIKITVIDPNELPCVAQLPKAFTPNGDGRNDTYGISNSIILEDKLIEFEIFDRWGGQIFKTNNPFDKWDGTFNGKDLNPGVLLYRVRYKCGEEEKTDMGSLTLIR
jgi:gliding motility-associated-like protein